VRRIAIVDDSPDVRALWRAELERSGEFEVCAEGDDGRQATEIALLQRPDVMLLDLSMPGLGGLHALPMVLDASPQTRVVVLSAMGRNQFSTAALSLGACGFLEKHLPVWTLVGRLQEVLDSGPAAAHHEDDEVPAEPRDGTAPLVEEEFLLALGERIGADTMREIVDGFNEATRERMGLVRCAVDVGDRDWVVRLGHQIRGSARSLAAPRLALEAEELELNAATVSTYHLREQAARLQLTVDDTIAALAEVSTRGAGARPAPQRG
jgi:DNA-binding NarL/FixJ family response regulator/HPt (histidine-containing phosphotransfer) domain-containing protein